MNDTHDHAPVVGAQTERDETLAGQAKRRVLALSRAVATPEQTRATYHLVKTEGWEYGAMGGFAFADGSVLCHSNAGWEALSATDIQALRKQPLEVRLRHSFQNGDGRETHSVAEAHFEPRPHHEGWRLVVAYEAYMNSPLYHFEAERFADLLELPLWNLRVDTPDLTQRWRLEDIASHPDWLELLHVSSAPG
jgi:hypothetical protein